MGVLSFLNILIIYSEMEEINNQTVDSGTNH